MSSVIVGAALLTAVTATATVAEPVNLAVSSADEYWRPVFSAVGNETPVIRRTAAENLSLSSPTALGSGLREIRDRALSRGHRLRPIDEVLRDYDRA